MTESTVRRAFSVAIFARRTAGPDAGRVLVIKHRRLGTWLPVGGELEPGESPLEAARRELREETGLEGRFLPLLDEVSGAPPGLLGYEEHPAGSKGTHLNFCFVADVDDTPLRPCDEYDEHRFVDAATLMTLSCPLNVRELGLRALVGGRHALVGVARAWLAAFNARDLDGLLALYADDAVHVSPKLRDRRPETGGQIVGKAAMREWWADAFARLPGLRYEERRVTAEGHSVFLEYARVVPGEPELLVAERYDVDTSGRIARSHVFHG
jgi:8-oxo-dGTP pyrophosphatase MutT (NUDIX family)/ketosteroid isomerase-like protein